MRQRSFLLFAAVVLGVLYAGLIVELPAGGFSQPEEGTRWLQIDSLWRHGRAAVAIDPPEGGQQPEEESAPAAFPLLASLPYALLGTRGAWLVPAAASILCMAAGARLARWVVPPGWSALTGVAMVAVTPLILYGAMLREETLGTLLAIAALIPICRRGAGVHPRGEIPNTRRLVASGLLMGLAAVVCPSTAPLIPAALVAGVIAWGRAAAGSPRPGSDPGRRFLVWSALLWVAGAFLFSGAGPASGWVPGRLVPASGACIIALIALAGARRGRPGGRIAITVLGIALGLGLAMQGAGLRRLAASRARHAAVLERVRGAVPDGSVILSDLPEVPSLLATLRRTTPALYVPRGSDVDSLSARLEAAGRSPCWIVESRTQGREGRGPAAMEALARYARGDQIDLGNGLILVLYEHEAGVRGFMTPPRGD